MELTLLGTGSPVPRTDRGGTSNLVRIDDEPLLVDCGPLTVHRMLENDVDPASVESLFFTHHHVDHNADFFEFVFGSWTLGRDALTVYGPTGTSDYVAALYDLYEEDIDYREWFGYPPDGIENIETVRTTADLSVSTGSWTVTALPVEHSIETYAYHFEDETTGHACVISGDTRYVADLSEFAADADVLVQDCCIGPSVDSPDSEDERESREERRRKHKQNHCDPEDAGRIAEEAGVETLVLTHIVPVQDEAATRDRAEDVFGGDVVVAEDGMTLEP